MWLRSTSGTGQSLREHTVHCPPLREPTSDLLPLPNGARSHVSNQFVRIEERRKAEAKPGEEIDMSDVMPGLQLKARDHSRVPMPVRTTPFPMLSL